MAPGIDHERLDVYRQALEFVGESQQIRKTLPQGNRTLSDQLQRAATSIALNIAEGAGEFSPREKVRFYRIARRSATECAAILDICQHSGVALERIAPSKARLQSIVAMLVALAKRHEATSERAPD